MNGRMPIAGLMLIACTAVASAASFEVVSGEGSMNKGMGFKSVVGTVAVQAGSTLHADSNATAFVVYDKSCRVLVPPGSFVRVQKKAPCGAKGHDLPAPGATATQQQNDARNCSDTNRGVLTECIDPLALGAVTLVGVGGLIWGISEVNKHNKNGFFPTPPLSP